jgi:prophage antirepressor-like protein
MNTAIIPLNISKDLIAKLGEQFNPLFEGIRIYGTIEQPLFVARDVEKALSLGDLHIRDRANFKEGLQYVRSLIPTVKGLREAITLTEYGLYQAMFCSASPLAEEYCRFIVIVMKQLRTQGVVTLESSLKELKEENLRLQSTVKMLDRETDDLKYRLTEAEDEIESRRAVNDRLKNSIYDARQDQEEAEMLAAKSGNLEYLGLLERAVMKEVYVHVSGVDSLEAADLPENEVFFLRLCTKKTLARHHQVATVMMINPTKQITMLGADHETSLTDLREIVESSNIQQLKAI